MPFTLAHPIATLPLWHVTRRYLDLPALIVGSMIPDVAYFTALRPVGNIGHSPLGILLEGIPSGLLLLLIGRYLLWDAVPALLASRNKTEQSSRIETESRAFGFSSLACRIPPSTHYRFWPFTRLLTIVLSIAVGALTHIIWDSATHASGWTVTKISWLTADVGPLPLYKWLQYGGGVIGLALLLAITVQTLHKCKPQHQPLQLSPRKRRIAWVWIVTATGLITWKAISILPTGRGFSELVVGSVIGIISGTFVGLCLYAVGFWSDRKLSARR